MILVDSEIKQYIQNGELIVSNYNEENITCVSYDLTVGSVILSKNNKSKEVDHYVLEPGTFVYVRSHEKIKIPNKILGRIAEKNSIMRLGLVVNGPHCQPGYNGYSFLRIYNISGCAIEISKNMQIAQIIFEQLSKIPDVPYNLDNRSSYINELTYTGLGKYSDEYNKAIKKIKNINEDLDKKVNKIYSDIITFMGIFISIFSIISINFQIFTGDKQVSLDTICKNMIPINLSLCIVITILLMIVKLIIDYNKKKIYIFIFIILLSSLAWLNIVYVNNVNEIENKNATVLNTLLEDDEITIRKVQEILKNKGYDIETTGILDKNSYDAINKYKKENNFESNSIIDLLLNILE